MATFLMFGKYTTESIKHMSIERTQQVVDEIQKLGGQVETMYAMMGDHDLLFCVQLPDIESAMKASIRLTQLTAICFKTAPAVTVQNFDRMIAQ